MREEIWLRLLQSVTCPFRSWHSLSGYNTYFMAFIGISEFIQARTRFGRPLWHSVAYESLFKREKSLTLRYRGNCPVIYMELHAHPIPQGPHKTRQTEQKDHTIIQDHGNIRKRIHQNHAHSYLCIDIDSSYNWRARLL